MLIQKSAGQGRFLLSRKLIVAILVVVGFAGLLPFLPQAWAYISAFVDLPIANPATYNVASSNQLISCTIPTQIVIPRRASNPAVTGNLFRCINNYNNPVTLKWSFVSGNPANLTISGSSPSMSPNDSGGALCRSVTFHATVTVTAGTYTIVFKGVTDPALNPDFYAEVQFSGSVKLNNSTTATGGCP